MSVNVQFRLRDENAVGPTSIRLHFYINGKRFVHSLGKDKRIIPELWDYDDQIPIRTIGINDRKVQDRNRRLIKKYESVYPNIKTELKNIESRIENLSRDISKYFALTEQANKNYDLNELKSILESRYQVVSKVVQSESKDVLELNEYISQFISELESGKRLTDNKKRYSKGTIKNYLGFQTQFKEYQDTISKILRFKDITIDFYDDFVSFFTCKNYSPNTIGRHIKNLKVIMRDAHDKGLHDNTEFERKRFKTIQVDSPSIYLSQKELDLLYNLDLSDRITWELARDVFLVGCYTALRYSDYSRISAQHIKHREEGTFIEIITKKTGESVLIPVRPELYTILKKYKFNLPKTYEQKVNSRIKEVAAMAGINESIEIEQIKGGMKVKRTIPKNELIKTHTARRTGATLMYLARIPLTDIMKITGHKTIRNLEKYIRVTKEETAKRLLMNPFFQGKTEMKNG